MLFQTYALQDMYSEDKFDRKFKLCDKGEILEVIQQTEPDTYIVHTTKKHTPFIIRENEIGAKYYGTKKDTGKSNSKTRHTGM